MIYVVADEQNYHFQALFAIMAKLGAPYAPGLHHLSYGMVDLPEGKMKSREGTVVDADDLIADVIEEARDAGVTEFLVKPFTANDIARRITHVINRPRDFIETQDFFGPDRRRRRDDTTYKGPLRRGDDIDLRSTQDYDLDFRGGSR